MNKELIQRCIELLGDVDAVSGVGSLQIIEDLLKAKLEKPEPVPVIYIDKTNLESALGLSGGSLRYLTTEPRPDDVPLYTSPPAREPLSDLAINTELHLRCGGINYNLAFKAGVRFAEKHHRIGVDDDNAQ